MFDVSHSLISGLKSSLLTLSKSPLICVKDFGNAFGKPMFSLSTLLNKCLISFNFIPLPKL